ncbi:alpha/beta hydrolase fold domain-containing protein [Nocardia sp. NPDC056100]|uniref:alpha/beta hydrolase fold domain-containing protein n=1 Tax=Nocardia sp. NPDC056100 TaxID=3345712 RepID=UPI0035DAD7DA
MSIAISPVSSVTVELANEADWRTRLVYNAGRRSAHPLLGALGRLGINVVRTKQVFAVTSYTDAPAALLVPPRGTRRRSVAFEKFGAEWLWDRSIPDPAAHQHGAILYFHGGGFIVCRLRTHRRLVARIAKASALPALSVDFRQLPKASYTDIIDDAVESYRYLLGLGFPAEKIILAGDSAGGGVAFRLAIATRERGLPAPGAIPGIAPWADLDWTYRNAHPNGPFDPLIPPIGYEAVARMGFAHNGIVDPTLSAVNHDFTGMPPALIQTGSRECVLADAEQLARRYADANIPLTLHLWDRAIHIHQAGADLLPDARRAIADIAAFNRRVIDAR